MLVLSRKNGESVRIGDVIEVKVLAIDGNRVKLGFSAPPNVDIQREELCDAYPRKCEEWEECCALG
jgi:carbon storage regulator